MLEQPVLRPVASAFFLAAQELILELQLARGMLGGEVLRLGG